MWKREFFFFRVGGLFRTFGGCAPRVSSPISACALVCAVDIAAGRATGLYAAAADRAPNRYFASAIDAPSRPRASGRSDSVIAHTTTAPESSRTCSRVEKQAGHNTQHPVGAVYLPAGQMRQTRLQTRIRLLTPKSALWVRKLSVRINLKLTTVPSGRAFDGNDKFGRDCGRLPGVINMPTKYYSVYNHRYVVTCR